MGKTHAIAAAVSGLLALTAAEAAVISFDAVATNTLYNGSTGAYVEDGFALSTAAGFVFGSGGGGTDAHLHLPSYMAPWTLQRADGRSFDLDGFAMGPWDGPSTDWTTGETTSSFTLSLLAVFNDGTSETLTIRYDAATDPFVRTVALELKGLSRLVFRTEVGVAAIDDIVVRPVPTPGAAFFAPAVLAAAALRRRAVR